MLYMQWSAKRCTTLKTGMNFFLLQFFLPDRSEDLSHETMTNFRSDPYLLICNIFPQWR